MGFVFLEFQIPYFMRIAICLSITSFFLDSSWILRNSPASFTRTSEVCKQSSYKSPTHLNQFAYQTLNILKINVSLTLNIFKKNTNVYLTLNILKKVPTNPILRILVNSRVRYLIQKVYGITAMMPNVFLQPISKSHF
jgi:hypothetical protein